MQGDWVVKPQFEAIQNFSNFRFIAVQINNKWGMINQKGDIVIEPKFEEIGFFIYGSIKGKTNGEWGIIPLL
jgi:hypothetical protein